MPIADRYGLPVSTASTIALERYQDGMDKLLAYGPGADECFAKALAADEGLALAHAGAALWSFLRNDGQGARAAIARADQALGGASRRERQHVRALAAVVGGEMARGLELIREHVEEFPRDALLVNQASSSIGFGGRADREEARLAFVERLAAAYGDDWWFQSALAFVYHEVGRFAEARRLSERSLDQYPSNANASHNIAHVFFETADYDGGVAFLEPWLDGYESVAPFHCHLAWHLALFELQRGHTARAIDIYERDIVAASNPRLAVMDGPALLWRLALYEEPGVSPPWGPLADLAKRFSRPGFVFGDVHAALVYASTGDDAALSRLMDGLCALEAKGHPIAGAVALPLVKGVASFAAGDYAGALAWIEPIDAQIHRVGGSHAQWELFEETMVACHLHLGRYDDAVRLLERRLRGRSSPRDLVWLDQARTGLAAAERARSRAASAG